jgi:hypothetical protein
MMIIERPQNFGRFGFEKRWGNFVEIFGVFGEKFL